jgi:tetratricopeptide (TPR) repeat protein
LGESLAAAGRHEEASRLFRRALSGDPANSRAACAAGWSAFQMNQLDSADRAFKRALRHPEMDATLRLEALRGRAWIAYRQGRVHDSMKIFRRASRLARRHGSADVKQDVERGFLRASYLAGTGDTTLAALAEACQTSKLETAIRMSAASLRSRLRGSGPRAGRA